MRGQAAVKVGGPKGVNDGVGVSVLVGVWVTVGVNDARGVLVIVGVSEAVEVCVGVSVGYMVFVTVGVVVGSGARKVGYAAMKKINPKITIVRIIRFASRICFRLVSCWSVDILITQKPGKSAPLDLG